MPIVKKFNYIQLSRETSNGFRTYLDPRGVKLPSVTTILSSTETREKKEALRAWRRRIGETAANEITKEASCRGTRLHKYIEDYVQTDQLREPGTNPYSAQSHAMAKGIIDTYIKPHIAECYGNEINLFYPELYAGTTDLVGLWDGELAIIDFKQTNRPKKREWIESYFLQLAAYAMAHNFLYETNIRTGVILMCSQDLNLQHWVISNDEFDYYSKKWAERVAEFYQVTT